MSAGVRSPREADALVGHGEAVAAFEAALAGGRLHHAWLLAGPQGVGKATFAHLAALKLLGAQFETGFRLTADDVVASRARAGGHGDLLVLERPWDEKTKKFKADIPVAEARRLPRFFATSAAEGGYRVAIVDAADDLNVNAANALLKAVEEPPQRGVVFLIAHQPGRLLPTIRSRCRRLDFAPLSIDDAALVVDDAAGVGAQAAYAAAEAAHGRPGLAVALSSDSGAKTVAAVRRVMERVARFDPDAALSLGRAVAAKDAAAGPPVAYRMLRAEAAQRARAAGSTPTGDAWAEAHQALSRLEREAASLYLDPQAAMVEAVTVMAKAARAAA